MKTIKISLIRVGADSSLPSAGVLYDATCTMYLHGFDSYFVFALDFRTNKIKIQFITGDDTMLSFTM